MMKKKKQVNVKRNLYGNNYDDNHYDDNHHANNTNNTYEYYEETMYDGEEGEYDYYYPGEADDEYYYEPYEYNSYEDGHEPIIYVDADGREYYYDSETGEQKYVDEQKEKTLYYTTTGNAKFVYVCGRGKDKGDCNAKCNCLGGEFHDDQPWALVRMALALLIFGFSILAAAWCFVKWNNKFVKYEELKMEREVLRRNAGMPTGRVLPSQTAPSPYAAAPPVNNNAAARARTQSPAPPTSHPQRLVFVNGAQQPNGQKQNGHTVMGEPVIIAQPAPQPLQQQRAQPQSQFQQVPAEERLPPTYYVVQ